MVAFVLAVCVGVANSALDTGGYPALMECFPTASGSAVILVKAMVSFGQMLYPMIVSYMLLNNIWYGYGVIIPGVLFVLITLLLLKSRFPRSAGGCQCRQSPTANEQQTAAMAGRRGVGIVWRCRLLDVLRHRGVDAEIRHGVCRYGGIRRPENHLLLQHGIAAVRVYLRRAAEKNRAPYLGQRL